MVSGFYFGWLRSFSRGRGVPLGIDQRLSYELLPVRDALAHMKTQGHRQTDEFADWTAGTLRGVSADDRQMPFSLGILTHGINAGLPMACQ